MRCLTGLLALVFAVQLYICAATASLTEQYQRGIWWLGVWANPFWMLLALGALLAVASVWPARRRFLARPAQHLLAWTLGISVVTGILLLASSALGLGCQEGWRPGRGVFETLRTSTLCPSFSLRSYAQAYYAALFSVGLLAIARYLARTDTDWTAGWPQQVGAALVSALVLDGIPGMWGWAFFVVPEPWPIRPILMIPVASVVIGLAFQVVFYPAALLCTRWRAPLWIAPTALGALVLAAALLHPMALLIAPYVAFALLAQLAVLRTPLPRRI